MKRHFASILSALGVLLVAFPALAETPARVEREVFRTFSPMMKWAFYIIAFATIGVFLFGAFKQYKKYMRGRAADRLSPLVPRLKDALGVIAAHSTLKKRDGFAGVAHFLVFWGFMVLLVGTTIVAIDEDMIQIALGPDAKILVGDFYLWFSLAMDLWGLLFIIGLLMMVVRRASFGLKKLEYDRVDLEAGEYDRSSYKKGDALFIWLLLFIAVSGFLIEGARIADNGPEFEKWSFVGWALAAAGSAVMNGETFFQVAWWSHVVAVFGFIAYLPNSKAMHVVTDVVSLVSVDKMAAIALPRAEDGTTGIKVTEDFSWRQLLAFDACTKCGRCHEACPARTTNAPLSPRDLILDLREHANRSAGLGEWLGFSRNAAEADAPIAGGYIKAETLWACTTCRACVEACPVGIEHVVDIVQMRRALIDQGQLDDQLQDALRGLDEKGNSFGESPRKRAKWAKALDFKIPDAQKEAVDFVWFVGDFASYNQACQDSTRNLAKILHKAGVSFGLLHKNEKSAGNDVRRVGEEGLFEVLVTDNMEQLAKCDFKRILTTDPHTYNTLVNEYPQFGGEYEVHHYSTLLLDLIREGTIELPNKLSGKVTYHDPCYLGRYNGIYDAPRDVVEACGATLVEMPRNRDNSFCCGAGGGRVWMPDPDSITERPSENRMNEAMTLGVESFIVACPKDMTMFADAVKTSGNEGKIIVRDLVDLVAEAMDLDSEDEASA